MSVQGDFSKRLPVVELPPNNQLLTTYEHIKDHLSQTPVLGLLFCETYSNSSQLYSFFKKCKEEMGGSLRYILALEKAAFSGSQRVPFNYELSFFINSHANLEGCALLTSLIPKYIDYYLKMNGKLDRGECEDEIIRSFIDQIKSLAALETRAHEA